MGLREKAKKYREIFMENEKGNLIKKEKVEVYKDKDLREKAIQIFLKSDIHIQEEEEYIYSLKDEITAAGKNKSIQIVSIVFLFIFIIFLSTKIISTYIDAKSRDLIVNIAEFSDLNIQEIIEAAKKSKEELDKVKNELSYLKENMDKEVEKIRKQFEEKQKTVVLSKDISETERKKILQKMKEEQEKAIREAALRYNKEIEERERYLRNIESKIKENEAKLEAERKKAEVKLREAEIEAAKKLDATRSLYEIKIKEMKDDFEKRKENYENEIRRFKAEIEENKKQISSNIARIRAYEDEIKSIKETYTALAEIKKKLEREIEILKENVNIYKMYITTFVEQMEILGIIENVAGYVFIANNNKCYLILNKINSVRDGQRGLIFDKNGKMVAKIEFANTNNYKDLRIFEANIIKKYYDIYPTYVLVLGE